MKKNLLIIVLLVATAGLAVVVVKQKQDLAQQKEQPTAVAVAEKATAPEAPPPGQAPATKAAEVPEPTAAPTPVPPPETPPVTQASASSSGSTNNFFSGIASMMKNPQMKEMVRAQQKMMINQQFGSLSKYLNLTAEQQDALKNLLLDRQMAMTDSGLAMMGGSEAERKQAAEDAKAIKAEYDQKIKDLLGPQEYQTYQDYEKTASERVQLQMFKGSLPNDAALTDQQEYDLLNAMYQARKDMPPSSLLNNQNPDPSQLTEEHINEAMKQMEQLQQAYAEKAKAILTPTQYEQFVQWQQQMTTMSAAGMKMAAQMFGNKSAPQPPAAKQGQTP
jgi:hypothetical protein